MTADQTQQLAQDIVSQTIAFDWRYWVVLAALLIATSFIGNWLGSYAAKRGEQQAVRADLQAILAQVRQTTVITEGIRSVVALGEWSERERRTLRRVKLEEMLLMAQKADDWLEQERMRLVHLSGDRETLSPLPMMVTLCKLYLPELQARIDAYWLACMKTRQLYFEIHGELLQARSEALAEVTAEGSQDRHWELHADVRTGQAQNAIRARKNADHINASLEAHGALVVLTEAAAPVMAAIIAAPPRDAAAA